MKNNYKSSTSIVCFILLSVFLAGSTAHAGWAWPWTAGELAKQAAANKAAAHHAHMLLLALVFLGSIGFTGCAVFIRHLQKNRTIVNKVIKNEIVQKVVKQEVIVRTPAHSLVADSLVVDGLNVIYGGGSNQNPNLLNLLGLLLELKKKGYNLKCYFDQGTFYTLKRSNKDQAYAYRRLANDYPQYFTEVPAGSKADDYILDFAHSHGTPIISNDRYRDYEHNYAWVKSDANRRISFVNDTKMLQILPLGVQAAIPEELNDAEMSLRMRLGETVPASKQAAQPARPVAEAWAHA